MVVAVIQARTGSKRLPGKVLKVLEDKTVIGHIISRLKRCNPIDEIWVATSTEPSDDALAAECETYGVGCFRGSLEDVLDRVYQVAALSKAEHVVRICGDTPLLDTQHVNRAISYYLQNDYDLVGIQKGTGGFEIFRFTALKRAWENADQPYHREHVTPYLYENDRVSYYVNAVDCHKYRYTLDTQEDWVLIKSVYRHLYEKDPYFSLETAMAFLDEHPEIAALNAHVQQEQVPLTMRKGKEEGSDTHA